jgi:hypothetical protein
MREVVQIQEWFSARWHPLEVYDVDSPERSWVASVPVVVSVVIWPAARLLGEIPFALVRKVVDRLRRPRPVESS